MKPGRQGAPLLVRHMVRSDLTEVVEVENASFRDPASADDIRRWLRDGWVVTVAEREDRVVGYLVHRKVGEEVNVLNLAVHPRWRRTGVGRALVERMVRRFCPPDCGGVSSAEAVTCVVPESSLAAQVFLRSLGFWCTDVLHGFFREAGEDGYLMTFVLPGG